MNRHDADILRALAEEKARIAALPAQRVHAELWQQANDLVPGRIPVYINELPWHEMAYNDELTLQCRDALAKRAEQVLRQELYCWRHLPGHMVVSGHIEWPVAVNDSGFGIEEDVDIVRTDAASGVVSRHFHIQIAEEKDIEKIKDPIISIDQRRTEAELDWARQVFEPVLPVVQVGVKGYWFTPWDNLIRLTGVTEAMTDLVDRPEYIEAMLRRFMDASLVRMRRYSELGLWSSNNDNTRVGSGGYGYTAALAPVDRHRLNAPLDQLWGCGNAQIFSEVSPEMHWDFSLKYELEWLQHFGLVYYGCCEQLHQKIDILKRIPNLRKISISPWADVRHAARETEGKYVLSLKPNPAIFAEDTWRPGRAREEIGAMLEQARGCPAELIMKDVSTVRYEPERVFEWAAIAVETAEGLMG